MRLSLGLALVVTFAACGAGVETPREPPRRETTAPPPGTSAVDRPHVIFTRGELVIDRLGTPVVPPVTASSQPSPATLASDDPGVVVIDATGALVGLQPGATRVREIGGSGSSLQVRVIAPVSLRAEPNPLRLAPGGRGRVVVLSEDGAEVPAGALRWQGVPRAIAVVGQEVHSIGAPGRYELAVSAAGARTTLAVIVGLPGAGALSVAPARARMKVGEVRLFQASGAGSARPTWASSNTAVLASVGEGLFQARRAGAVRACATLATRKICSDVEVTP